MNTPKTTPTADAGQNSAKPATELLNKAQWSNEIADGMPQKVFRQSDVLHYMDCISAERDALKAEVETLRAALQNTTRLLALLNAPGTNDPIEAAVHQARAALAKGDK